MATIKYDVSDVESGGGGEEPQPGTYPGKIVACTNRKKSKSNEVISDLEVVCDIGQEYVRLWTYIKLPDDPGWAKEKHGWKLRELTDALGLPPKGGIDTKKIIGTPVLVKVAADTNQDGDYRGKIKNLFAIGDQKAPQSDPDANDGGNDDGPYSIEELSTWSDADLKGYAEELSVEIPKGRGAKEKLINAIYEAQPTDEDEPEDEPAAAASSGGNSSLLDSVDPDAVTEVEQILENGEGYLADWSDDDIKWLVEALRIEGNVKTSGRGWQGKAKTALVEFAQEALGDAPDGAGDHDAGAGEIEDDMDDVDPAGNPVWSDQDLKDEIASRNEQGAEIVISGRWSRAKAIAALREDNANAEPF